MRRITVALTVIVGVLLASAATASAQGKAGDVIPGSYIVVLKPDADPSAVAQARGVKPAFVYRNALNGFAARLTERQVQQYRASDRVAYVERDQVYTASATQNNPPWGLDRSDQRNLPLSNSYTYNATGAGVTSYVVDTGLQSNHPDFGGRARNVYDALGLNGEDCNGHGTHVGGTMGGTTYGVAKGTQLRGLRVLNCAGSGSTAGIVSALDWLRANAVKPAVANMSLGGGKSTALNNATTNLSNSGVFVAVAAGNENQDACNVSPASTPVAYTTAASDRNDAKASFSNFGTCVDGYAPGVGITSAYLLSGSRSLSGTSMASPHVAGVAALYKSSAGEQSSAAVSNWIATNSTPNVIGGNPAGTPNRLLFTNGL